MNAFSFVAAFFMSLVPAVALGQGLGNKDVPVSADSLAGQCLSLSMSSPAKGMAMARTILNRADASAEARIVRAIDCMGHAEAIAGKKDAARADEERALESLNASNISDAFRANILSNAGGVFTVLGDSHRAVALFEQANALGKEHNLPMAQIAALMNLAGLYCETLNDPPKADAYYKQAIQLAKPLHRDDVYMYFNYAFNLLEMKKYDEALPVLNHVIQMSGNSGDLEGVRYRAESELATVYLAKGNSLRALPLLH